jgi:hypothetical protein
MRAVPIQNKGTGSTFENNTIILVGCVVQEPIKEAIPAKGRTVVGYFMQ